MLLLCWVRPGAHPKQGRVQTRSGISAGQKELIYYVYALLQINMYYITMLYSLRKYIAICYKVLLASIFGEISFIDFALISSVSGFFAYILY